MITFRLKLSKSKKRSLTDAAARAEKIGDYSKVKRILSLLLISDHKSPSEAASFLNVTAQAVRSWLSKYLSSGLRGLKSGKSPGRPPKLTKSQKKELAKIIESGPEASGFPGACWRTPMLQHLIKERFGVFYNAHYLSSLLKNMGFSYQTARFIASKQDEKERKKWLEITWPEILKLAEEKNSYILFGDEASFPQWGTLSYTWAPIGKQPTIQTCGIRKCYKVFGLIDYFTGKFLSKGYVGQLNGDTYVDFIKGVLAKTRKHIILVQDGAPYHRSKAVNEFFSKHTDRLTVYKLPAYSPDFNPIEKLWKKIKEKGVHMKYFPTFDDLKLAVNNMLGLFGKTAGEVLPLFGFYKDLCS